MILSSSELKSRLDDFVNEFIKKNTNTKKIKKKNETVLFVPDAHVTSEQDLTRFSRLSEFIDKRKPDTIIIGGDFADMLSLNQFDKNNKLTIEGRRYKAEVTSVNKALDKLLSFNKDNKYNPRLVYIEGNHECVHVSTEILTLKGWIPASQIDLTYKIASFDDEAKITFDKPIAIEKYINEQLVSVKGYYSDELVSKSHNLYYDKRFVKPMYIIGSNDSGKFTYTGNAQFEDYKYNDDKLLHITNYKTKYPLYFLKLSKRQVYLVLNALLKHSNDNRAILQNKYQADIIQGMCVINGIKCKIEYDENEQVYVAIIGDNHITTKEVEVKYEETTGDVIAIQTKNKTLITRRNGCVSFTGNCRITRYVEQNPQLESYMSYIDDFRLKERGFEVVPYKKFLELNGILFGHCLMSTVAQAVGGKYAAHKAAALTSKSIVFCHTHKVEEVSILRHGSDDLIQVYNAGCFFDGREPGDYTEDTTHIATPCISLLTIYKYGRFDIEQISLHRLMNRQF